ncbi:hypothetical protein [Nocardia sp. NPDC003979]
MTVNTKIDGDPASLRAVAGWLRDTLANQLDMSATDLNSVRMLAESGWDGEAGDAFTVKARGAFTKTDGLADEVRTYAAHFDSLAGDIQTAQTDMDNIRRDAAAAGLTVRERVVEKPSDDDPDMIAAYNTAALAADVVRERETFWGNTWKNMQNDIKDKWFLVVGDLVGGGAAARAVLNSSMLRSTAAQASSDALKALIEAKNAPAGTPRETIYRDMDWSREQMQNAGKALDDAEKAKANGKTIGLKVGGALAVAGIAYDIHNGKPVEQAVVSGTAGFAASVAVGAAVGSIVPGPGTAVGALAGAVVGAGAGIFTSGAVDSLYTDGLSVGGAVNGGIDALEATGDAIGSGVSKAWNAIF